MILPFCSLLRLRSSVRHWTSRADFLTSESAILFLTFFSSKKHPTLMPCRPRLVARQSSNAGVVLPQSGLRRRRSVGRTIYIGSLGTSTARASRQEMFTLSPPAWTADNSFIPTLSHCVSVYTSCYFLSSPFCCHILHICFPPTLRNAKIVALVLPFSLHRHFSFNFDISKAAQMLHKQK